MKFTKDEGSTFLHSVIVLGMFMIGVIITIYIYSMSLTSTIKSQMEDDLSLSNVSAATIDINNYVETTKIQFIDIRESYDDFLYSFTTNMGLEETSTNVFKPQAGSYFENLATEFNIVSFIIYNVDGTNITKEEYNADSDSVTTTNYTTSQVTPDGTVVEENPTLYSKVQVTLDLPGGISQTVTRENSVAIVLTH